MTAALRRVKYPSAGLHSYYVEGRGIPAKAILDINTPLHEDDIDHSLAIWTPGPVRPEPAMLTDLYGRAQNNYHIDCHRIWINYRCGIQNDLLLDDFTTVSARWLKRAFSLLTFSKLQTHELNWPGFLYTLKNGKYRWTIDKSGNYKYKDILTSKFGIVFDVMNA